MELMCRLLAILPFILAVTAHAMGQPQGGFPPGGLTPVFNEVEISFAITPTRPAPDANLDDIPGPTERVKMVNMIDRATGIVQPTIFVRGDTETDAKGIQTQTLQLANDSGLANSKIFGGELTMYVRPPVQTPAEAKTVFPHFPAIVLRAPNKTMK